MMTATVPTARHLALAAVAALALLAGACAGDDGGSVRETSDSSGSASGSASGSGSSSGSSGADCTDEATGDTTVEANVGEWFITPSTNQVPAGSVVIDVENTGEEVHEVLVVRGDSRSELPTKEDGSLDESELPEGAVIGEVEGVPAGGSCSASFDLEPGRYFLLCNIVEEHPSGGRMESHLREGMIAPLTVT